MEAKELRQFGVDELKGRVRQWREELFRTRFKGRTAEAQDTSVSKKLKKDIARALTILNQKVSSGEVASSVSKAEAVPDKKVAKAAPETKLVESKETKKAKTTKKKKAE